MDTRSAVYYVGSQSRISGTDSDFYHDIPHPTSHLFKYAQVVAASIPKSYYLLQAGYTTFSVSEGVLTYNVTLDPGNYTRRSLAIAIGAKVTAASAAAGGTVVLTCSQPNVTQGQADDGKYIMTVPDTGFGSLHFTFTEDSPIEALGVYATTYAFTLSGGVYSFKSVRVCNLQPETQLMIRSDIASNGYKASLTGNDVLCAIYVGGVGDFAYVAYQSEGTLDKRMLRSEGSSVFRFWLTNENGRPIDLNGVNWTFTLVLFDD